MDPKLFTKIILVIVTRNETTNDPKLCKSVTLSHIIIGIRSEYLIPKNCVEIPSITNSYLKLKLFIEDYF